MYCRIHETKTGASMGHHSCVEQKRHFKGIKNSKVGDSEILASSESGSTIY